MAQIGSYAQALGDIAKESAVGSLKGLAQGMKFAALRELPALSAGMVFAKDVSNRAAKIDDVTSKNVNDKQTVATENLVKQQATNNVISLDMARQLRAINANVQSQRQMMGQQIQSGKRSEQFAEEDAREKADFNRKLLRALESMGGGAKGSGSSATGADASGGGILDSILGAIGGNLGDIIGGALGGYGAYKGIRSLGTGGVVAGGGRGGRGGGPSKPSGPRGPTYRDPKTGRFSKRPPGLFRRGLGAFGRVAGAVGRFMPKFTPWTAAIGAGLTGLSFAPDIYDYFAGPPGGDLDVTPQDRQRALSRSFLTRFLSGGAERRAGIEAATRLRRARYQRPTPYAQGRYGLENRAGRTGARQSNLNKPGLTNPGGPGSSPAITPNTVPPPANLPSGASQNINDLIIQAESGGRTNAAATTSRAYGLGQFVPKTFNGLVAQAKPGDALYGKTFDDYKASPALQRAAMAKLTEINVKTLQTRQIPIDDVSIYLAHFLGAGGATRVLRAPDTALLTDVVAKNQRDANPAVFSKVKTVADLKAWARKKINQARKDLGTSSGRAAAASTPSSPVEGSDYNTQLQLTQQLGAAFAKASNDSNTSPLAREKIKTSYEVAAAKLATMQGPAAAATSEARVLPGVTVTGKKVNKPGLNIPDAPGRGWIETSPGTYELAVDVLNRRKENLNPNRAVDAFLAQNSVTTANAPTTRGISVASTSGTSVTTANAPLPVVDEEANLKLDKIEKSQGKVEKETKGLSASSKLAARNFLRRERPTRRILSPEEEADEYLKKAQQGFLNAFDKTLTKTFKDFGTNFLKSVGYAPGGASVSTQEAMRVGYAGNQLGKMLDLDKKVAKGLEKIIGKEYGRMLAPAVSQLGKAYLNSMAVGIGQSLFSGVGGRDAKSANAITGQILGNLAKGNKQIAMEQLLYGLTGIASGPETIAQSYGFRSAAEGIGYTAEVFAARSTDAVRGFLGYEDRTTTQQMRDPVTGRLFTPDQAGTDQSMRNIAAGGYGGIYRREAAQTLKTSQMTTLVGKSNNLLTEGAQTLNGVLLVSVVNAGEFASDDEKFKSQMLTGLTGFATKGIDSAIGGPFGVAPGYGMRTPDFNPAEQSRYSVAQGTPDLSLTSSNRYGLVGSDVASDISSTYQLGKQNYDLTASGQRMSLNAMNASTQQNVSITSQADQNNQAGMDNQTQQIVHAINTQPRASGGGSMGGSFGGDFTSFLGNMAVSFVANKLTSKIKNPYVRAIANFGIQRGAQSMFPSVLGGPAAGGAAAGASGGSLLTAMGIGSTGAAGMMSLPSAFGAAGGFSGLGNAFTNSMTGNTAGGLGLSGFAANTFANMGFAGTSNFFAGMNAAGTAGLTTAGTAGYYAGQALPYAAAITQLFQGNVKGAATTAALTYIGTAIGGPIGGFIGSVIGSVLGKGGKKAPPPKIVDKVLVMSEKDIAKKTTVREENSPSDGQKALVDAFLNVAFNTAMSIYQATKSNPPFVAVYISLKNNELRMALPASYSGGVITDGWVIDLKMEEKKSASFYMLEIMRKIKDVYKASSQDPEYLKKIDEGYKLVSNKSAGQLAGGLIANLKYGKYAIDGKEYQFGDSTKRSAQSYILGKEAGRTIRGTTEAGMSVTTQTNDTSGNSLTPSSGTTTSVNITPAAARTAGGASGAGNVSVVTDNSTKNIEGSTVNTTYLNTSSGGDVYGRAGVNTSMPMRV